MLTLKLVEILALQLSFALLSRRFAETRLVIL
jgi:hypothetical protein